MTDQDSKGADISAQAETDAVVERVRQFVRGQLAEGTTGEDLSFALAFVSTEMGLAISPDPLQVFPVVLAAVTQAAANRSEATLRERQERASATPVAPSNTTVH